MGEYRPVVFAVPTDRASQSPSPYCQDLGAHIPLARSRAQLKCMYFMRTVKNFLI